MKAEVFFVIISIFLLVLSGCYTEEISPTDSVGEAEKEPPEDVPQIEQSQEIQKDSFSFVVYGDSRGKGDSHGPEQENYVRHQQIAELIKKRNPDFIFHTGDIVEYGPRPAEWEIFKNITEDICRTKDRSKPCWESTFYLDSNYFPAIGNHEKIRDGYENYFSVFPFLKKNDEEIWTSRYYSLTYGNTYFIILDSSFPENIRGEKGNQYNWLVSELEKTETYEHIFVFFHHPPYGTSGEDHLDVQQYWVPLFKEHNVDIVFNGHHHHYARQNVDGVLYVTTGGGGASLYPVNPTPYLVSSAKVYHYVYVTIDDTIEVSVYDINNNLIEEFSL